MKRYDNGPQQVEAAPIKEVFDTAVIVYSANLSLFLTVQVPPGIGFFDKGTPLPGDYLLKWPDGALEWRAKAAFEAEFKPQKDK